MGRLVEYVITVGIKKPRIDTTQSPELLRRFPLDDHKDFPLPPDIVFFCQPEGCSSALRRISLRQTNTFVFTLTDKDSGITRYGICCNFFRPCFGLPKERYHNEVGKSYSYDSVSSSEEHHFSHRNVRRNEPKLTKSHSLPLHGFSDSQSLSSMLCFSLTSICIVTSYPFFSTFRECLFVCRKLVESRTWTKDAENIFLVDKKICFDGNQNVGQIPLLECRNWSIFLNNNEPLPQLIKSNLLEIDDWINNLLKIPLPVAGVNRVEVELLPRHIQPPLTFALPEKSRFSFLDYPIHLPLELLGVETCLKILTCIILEHKVVLQSCDYNALSISVMALTSMLYPLQYMFPIIPLLPTCMKNAEHLLLAPTPYIIGIPSSFFRIKGASFQVPHDVLIVDLDTNKMSVPLSMDEIPSLPEPEGSELKSQLNECMSCLSFTPLPVNNLDEVPDYANNFSDALGRNNFNHMIYGNDIDSVDIAVRAALVKFFSSHNVLGNLMHFTRILRLYPRPVVAFLKHQFLNSREDKSGFLCALIETQAVEYYAEWMVNPDNSVYRKVENGILDPRIIGDKPRWYSHYVQPLYYQVHNPQSQLGTDLYEDSDTDTDDYNYPSIIEEKHENENESEDVVDVCSCCSSFEESDGDINESVKAILSSDVNEKIYEMYDSSYSTFLDAEGHGGFDSSSVANSVYTPPAYRSEDNLLHSMPSDEIESDAQINENYSVNSDQTSSISSFDHVPVSTSTEKTSTVNKINAILGIMKPKLTRRSSSESLSNISVSSSNVLQPFFDHGSNIKQVSNKFHTNVSNQKIYRSSSYVLKSNMKNSHQEPLIYNNENQQLITEVIAYIKSGDGIGWLTTKKLRKIVVDEGLRQYMINQIDNDSSINITLHDVHITRNVYRGYLELLKLVVEGFEFSTKSNKVCGMSSLFSFLEIAGRYYCGKKYADDSTKDMINKSKKHNSREPEQSLKLETNFDVESDHSLHFHRDLSKLSSFEVDKSYVISPPSLTITSLEGKSNGDGRTHPKCTEVSPFKVKEGIYLVSKSNCSGGYRFYGGMIEKAVFEPAGRGVSGTGRRYLFEGLLRNRSWIWDDLDIWERCFLDFVASEREATGMDVNPVELILRYNLLSSKEKRSLEEDEDILLGIILHNMIAFMLYTNVSKANIKMKVRRLLAKAHIGLTQTQWIDNLLDALDKINGNDIDLLPPRSRQLKIQIFVVHLGDSQSGPVFFLEVREDCIVIKSTNGCIVDRWWYENVVNLSCSPRTKVLCIWIRSGEETDLHKICTKKCKLLYNSIKDSMKKAADKLNKEGSGINLGGDFTVMETLSKEHGVLKVSLEGLTIIFVDKKISIDLQHLKNCCAKQKILLVEEYLPHSQTVIEHQFFTEEANEICYAILCLFSYIAAARNHISLSRNSASE